MLLQLEIHDIALIEKAAVEFGEGLNVLTGETGAGKSIIIDSINAVLGGRVSRDIIRTGSDRALVEAVFRAEYEKICDIMNEMGMEPEEDGTLILSREISQSGKNTCRVNGKMVAASFLKMIGERLIDIHGQHDNQSLLKVENHIDLLDSFGGENINIVKREYLGLLGRYRDVRARLKALSGDPGERERKMDLLKFQVDEIKKAKLAPGEEEQLARQKTLLANAEKISASLSAAYALLSSGDGGVKPAVDAMNEALAHLGAISRFEKDYGDACNRLQDLVYQAEDLAGDLRRFHESVEYDPALLERIEERLDLIYKLKRKYGADIRSILEYCAAAEKKLVEIETGEETVNLLKEQLAELDEKLCDAARRMSLERSKAASALEELVGRQLNDLEMKKAEFKVDIQFESHHDAAGERKYTQYGLDKVEFLISPNVGEPLKPLARIASGGEMSRIMLAIKTILADADKIPTLIFDEIDNGISGRTAHKVGEKLSRLSSGHQVICVTHLAQIACMADHHYLIEKTAVGDRTRTTVTRLEGGRNIGEIARLISGSDMSETSLKHAEEMIGNAKKMKKN